MDNALITNFGKNCFNDKVMKERLPESIYKALHQCIDEGKALNIEIANEVANAMKNWAMEKGATHYTHWFQPMTGMTAEKHDSFLDPDNEGNPVAKFSGKALIKGESDASSFPSGGLRATFEARGYTVWDPTSFAFVKGHTLYIPTAFCSYSGEVLDKKTPLLRSMDALDKQACRMLNAIGYDVKKVTATVGAEQEYFLIDRKLYNERPDLIFTGRTLFGNDAPKGQEMHHNYYRNLKERVSSFMEELDNELWGFGIFSKTKHNEVAPAQHELAPVFCTCNLAADQNQLTMEMMKKIARRHGLFCLLHEKPFNNVNGSGKHNNWSITTDKGENLLDPGTHPDKNRRFMLILTAIISAVDQYSDLLRLSVATASNDCRLGGHEAPPAIISVFVGAEIEYIIDCIVNGKDVNEFGGEIIDSGVRVMPKIYKDNADRNRTSPFAFTGNKFEFRMPGSSQSISGVNVVMNTMVAEMMRRYADRLEKADDVNAEIQAIIKEELKAHSRIIFNGNNYSKEWVEEAERRGLPNYSTTFDALVAYIDQKNIDMYVENNIYMESELAARYEVSLEGYASTVDIEGKTMVYMAHRQIIPAVMEYSRMLFEQLKLKNESGLGLVLTKEKEMAADFTVKTEEMLERLTVLEDVLEKGRSTAHLYERAKYYKEEVIPAMQALRTVVDRLEYLTGGKYWPLPNYAHLLFDI
ncbi:MAG: glutamine synthetase III [Bacillota bacterium]|jgi:glutamine synthetase